MARDVDSQKAPRVAGRLANRKKEERGKIQERERIRSQAQPIYRIPALLLYY